MESENVTDGLRESSRYASDRNVVISNTRSTPLDGPALRPDRPERLTLVPHRVGPAPDACPDLVGPSVGREVEVETVDHGTIAGDEQVADRAADQVQVVPGRGETFGERGQLGQNGLEAVRNHGLRGYWRRDGGPGTDSERPLPCHGRARGSLP